MKWQADFINQRYRRVKGGRTLDAVLYRIKLMRYTEIHSSSGSARRVVPTERSPLDLDLYISLNTLGLNEVSRLQIYVCDRFEIK